jgi:hypothetical protein
VITFQPPAGLIQSLAEMRTNSASGQLPALEVAEGVHAPLLVQRSTDTSWVLGVLDPSEPAGCGPAVTVLVAPGVDTPWAVYGGNRWPNRLEYLGDADDLPGVFELALTLLAEHWDQ